MVKKDKKINKKEVVSVTLLITTLMICGYFLFTLLSWVIAYDAQNHDNKMEELNLEKEIALINNEEVVKIVHNNTYTYKLLSNDGLIDKYCIQVISDGRVGYLSMGPAGSYLNCLKFDGTWEKGNIFEYLEFAENKQRSD